MLSCVRDFILSQLTFLFILASKHFRLLIFCILILISERFLLFCLPKRMLLFLFYGVHNTFPRAADAPSCSESFNFLVRSQHFWQQQLFIGIIQEERSRSTTIHSSTASHTFAWMHLRWRLKRSWFQPQI